MSLHAVITQRGRRTIWGGFLSVILCAGTIFTMLLAPAPAFAQTPPGAVTLTKTIAEDTPITIDTTIPVDIGNRYQVAVIVPGPAHGTAVETDIIPRIGNYDILYTPGANRTETIQFDYQLCTIAPPVICGTRATVTVIITAVNDGPQAGGDNFGINQDQSVLINVLANDNGGPDEPGDFASLVAGSISAPMPSGAAVIEGNQIRFTPTTGFCSSTPVTFTYRIQDTSGLQTVGTVNVHVRCPGQPILKLDGPKEFSNHTFKVDVILESPDINVAALDFVLNYTCLTDPDMPTDNKLADDITTTLPPSNFLFQVQDQTPPTPGALRFVMASTTSPASILAGPGATATRTIATLTFKAVSFCTPVDLTFGVTDFIGTNGSAIPGGGSTVNSMSISVTNANNAPSNILLDDNRAPENTNNAFVGKLSTIDPDTADTHTYGITAGNGFFIGFVNELYTNGSLPAGNYNITIQSTDNYGGFRVQNFVIEITNINQPPVALGDTIIVRGRTPAINLLANDSDPDSVLPGCTGCSIQSVTNGSKGTVTNQGLSVTYIPTDPKATSDSFTYILTDNDPSGALTAQAQVNATLLHDMDANLQEVKFGDCNKDAKINAGDLTATGLEIFDGDGANWYNADLGTYAFSPYGCDSNADPLVDAGDISCTAQKIFNNAFTCGVTLAASRASTATLAVGTVNAAPGATVQVPVRLQTAGYSVAAAAFAIDINRDELSFDDTDADGDGVADAVSLNVPGGLLTSAVYNADESRIEIVVTGLIPPFPTLADGALATVRLTVKEGVDAGESTVALTNSSLGSDEGQSVPLEVTAGAIQITQTVSQPANRVLLPLINR